MKSTNELSKDALESVNGGLIEGSSMSYDYAQFHEGDKVTCFRKIHWIVLKVYRGADDVYIYKLEACEVPANWADWTEPGKTLTAPEKDLTSGWH